MKALRVLEAVAVAGECSLGDLLSTIDLPKSTLLRILGSLVDERYLDRPAHGRYRPALKLWRLGCRAIDFESVQREVVPTLRKLVKETSETALYAVYEDGRATYVDKVEGSHPIRAYTIVGSSSPAYASATGKALLAWQPDAEVVNAIKNAEAFTASTTIDADDFRCQIEEIHTRGYAVNRGEWREGVWGIAAPIFGLSDDVVAALGISGPESRVADRIEEFSNIVVQAAAELSARFGHRRSLRARELDEMFPVPTAE